MKLSNAILLILVVLFTSQPLMADKIERDLKPFSRIIASPHVNLILREGENESIVVEYHDIDDDKINIEVRGKTLRIFLDEARMTDRLERVDRYRKYNVYAGVSIKAYVTYRRLEKLEIRGAQELICESPITSEKFKLKAYGENVINITGLQTGFFKTHLYGENRLTINAGRADYQKYKLYGENKIDATQLKSYSASTISFGDSEIDLQSQDELRVTSFGEAKVYYTGNAYVNKGLIFGDTEIQKLN